MKSFKALLLALVVLGGVALPGCCKKKDKSCSTKKEKKHKKTGTKKMKECKK